MFELKITAASADELVEKLAHLTGGFVAKVDTNAEPAPTEDPYGDGNGPVDVVAPTPAQEPEELVDERGVVWDERYHASTKKMTAVGAWKKKKGANADELAAYENQYLNPPTADEAPVEAPVAPAPVMPQTDTAPAQDLPSGPEVMTFASKIIQDGTKTPDYLSELAERCGMQNIGALFNDVEKRRLFLAELEKDGFAFS